MKYTRRFKNQWHSHILGAAQRNSEQVSQRNQLKYTLLLEHKPAQVGSHGLQPVDVPLLEKVRPMSERNLRWIAVAVELAILLTPNTERDIVPLVFMTPGSVSIL